MEELTAREEEIADLREQKSYSYKAIGALYDISPSRASQIHQRVQRKRREERRRVLYLEENKKTVSFDLTLGEAEVLMRILLAFTVWKMDNGRHTIGGKFEFFEDVDYIVAGQLDKRLRKLERDTRTPLQFD